MGRFVKGQSGNPAGRTKGSKDKRTELRALLNPRAPELVDKAVELALAGDNQALKLCLDRLIAPLRSTTPDVSLSLEGTLPERGEKVLEAMANGELDPVTGSALIGALADQAKLKEQTELEERLRALEGKS